MSMFNYTCSYNWETHDIIFNGLYSFRFHVIEIIFTQRGLFCSFVLQRSEPTTCRQEYSLIAPMYVRGSSLHTFLISHIKTEWCEDLLGQNECRLLVHRKVSPPLGRKYWERSATKKSTTIREHAWLNNAWK